MSWIGNIINAIFDNEGSQQESVVRKENQLPNLQSMTKRQLETYGRTLGVELDRRHNKAKLIARLESVQ